MPGRGRAAATPAALSPSGASVWPTLVTDPVEARMVLEGGPGTSSGAGFAAPAAPAASSPAGVSVWLPAAELTFILVQLLHLQAQTIGSPWLHAAHLPRRR